MEWKGNLALDENKKNSHNLNSLIFQTPPYQPTNGFKAEKKKRLEKHGTGYSEVSFTFLL